MTRRRRRGGAAGPLGSAAHLGALARHDQTFADLLRGQLDLPLHHTPGWTMADLVRHRTSQWRCRAHEADPVHGRVHAPPQVPDDRVLEAFLEASRTLVTALSSHAGPASRPGRPDDVGPASLLRLCSAESAVQLWDAARAVGRPREHRLDTSLAAELVETLLVAAGGPSREPLEGEVVLCACLDAPPGVGETPLWRVADDGSGGLRINHERPRSLAEMADRRTVVAHTRSDALLAWLSGRDLIGEGGDLDQAHLVLLDARRRGLLRRLVARTAAHRPPLSLHAAPVGGTGRSGVPGQLHAPGTL